MMLLRFNSVRSKMTAVIVLSSAVVLSLTCVCLLFYEIHFYRDRTEETLASLADVVGANCAAPLMFGDNKAAAEALVALRMETQVVRATLFNAAGGEVDSYVREDFARSRPRDGQGPDFGPTLAVVRPIHHNGAVLGRIRVESDLSPLRTRIFQSVLMLTAVFAFSMLVAIPIASRLQRPISGPILQLSGLARKLSQCRAYSLRATAVSNDEVGSLVQSFNDMLAQIQARDLDLQAGKETLEQRVAERTRELSSEVSLRKQAQEKAEERLAFLNALIQTNPLAVVVLDEQHRIRLCNPAFERLFEYSQQEIEGVNLDSLLAPPEFLAEAKWLSSKGARGEGVQAITRRRKKSGAVVDVEIHGVPLMINGVMTGAFALYQDITLRKAAENQMRRAKEAAEQASRAKSEFLANMSHEIRTPMNGIMGMTELALDTELSEEQREYLDAVLNSADSLLSIINDILDFSKVEAGRLELDPVPFRLRECITDTIRPLAIRAGQKGLELTCEVNEQVPEAVVGDPGRLRQILVNLIGNAIKFTERGDVHLTVRVMAQPAGQVELHFAIRDTGIGVPIDQQSRIFEAFVQADGSTTRRFGGTGLGLTIASRLVSMMGGRIWLESDPGIGSTFHFTAVVQVQQDVPAPSSRLDASSVKGLPILVADDNATNRRYLEETLTSWGMVVMQAGNGAEALARMREAAAAGHAFALLVADCHLPELDGFALAEQIQRDSILCGTRIIMLTSAGQRGDAARCRELGVSAYLNKPVVTQSQVLQCLLEVLGKQKVPVQPLLLTRQSIRE